MGGKISELQPAKQARLSDGSKDQLPTDRCPHRCQMWPPCCIVERPAFLLTDRPSNALPMPSPVEGLQPVLIRAVPQLCQLQGHLLKLMQLKGPQPAPYAVQQALRTINSSSSTCAS